MSPIVGSYELVKWPAYGAAARGRLRYGRSGEVWVMLDVRGHGIDPEELSRRAPNATGEEFVAYYGRYRWDSGLGTVLHIVEIASGPELVGASLLRWYRMTSETLLLSVNPEFRNALTWRLVSVP